MKPFKFIILPLMLVGACIAQDTLLKSLTVPGQADRGEMRVDLNKVSDTLARIDMSVNKKLIQEMNVPFSSVANLDFVLTDISGDGLEDLLVSNAVTAEGRSVMQAYIWRNGFLFKDDTISDIGEIVLTQVPGCVHIETKAEITPIEKATVYCITTQGSWKAIPN